MNEHIVIIFAYHFPPEEVIGGARPFRFAKYLSRLGYKCRVFTAAERSDYADPIAVTVRDPFFARQRRGFGWRFERMFRKFLLPGDLGLEWSYRAFRAAREYVEAHPGVPITILSTFPPLGTHLAAWQLAHDKKYCWIADYRDPMRNQRPEEPISRLHRRMDRWLEHILLRSSDAVIANTDGAMVELQKEFPLIASKVHLIWNGFDPEARIHALPVRHQSRWTLAHVGELYKGRTASPILESVARLIAGRRIPSTSVRVRLCGTAEPGTLPNKEFLDRASSEGWLELRTKQIPKSEALQIIQSANALLLLQPQSALQVPGKLFELLQIGRPILAFVQRNSPSERVLEQCGVPYRCVYPDSTTEAIDKTVVEFLNLPSDVISAKPWFEEHFNSEQQTQQLHAIIRSLHADGEERAEKKAEFILKSNVGRLHRTHDPTKPRSPDSETSTQNIDRSFAVGIAWTAGAKWSTQILSWASFVVVTRLLAPSDLGLVGMAVLLCGLLQVVIDAFGMAVTTLRDLSNEQLAQLNTVASMSGFLGFIISCAIAIPLGHFFRSPHLPSVVAAMSVTFLTSGFQTVPYGLLYRDMRFKLLSILTAVQSVIQALTMLSLAWLGYRYWSLVVGNIVGAALLAGLQIACRPHRFAIPKRDSLKNALTFSRHIMVSSFCWYGYSNADFLVAGRMLGEAALGAYTLAWNLATIPLEKVATILSNVSYAYLSAAQNNSAALRRYLRILTEGLSLITFPATIGMALVADDLVQLLLGTKWKGAVAPLEILAAYASFRCLVTLLPSILNVTGESRFVMRTTQFALFLMPGAFYIGSKWGARGIAFGWVIAYPLIAVGLYWKVAKKIDMPAGEYLEAIRPAFTGSLIMIGLVEILKHLLLSRLPLSVRFGSEVLIGCVAYIFTLRVLHRERVSVFWRFLKTLRDPIRANVSVEKTFTG